MPDHQAPRPILLGAIEPIFRHLGHCMGVITRNDFALFTMKVEFCIEVLPLPFVGDKPVKTGSWFVILFTHVPLANVGSMVTQRLQDHRKAFQLTGIFREVVRHSVVVCVQTTEDASSARRAQRSGAKSVTEVDALATDPVDIGSL